MYEKKAAETVSKVAELGEVLQVLALAIAAGALARVFTAAHEGVRGLTKLLIEAGLGGVFGAIALGAAVYWFKDLRAYDFWQYLTLGAIGGAGGVVGVKVPQLVLDVARKRAGG